MKDYLMYNDNYHPPMAEGDITSAVAYSEYDSKLYTSDEWPNSRETTPILPLPENGSDWLDQENGLDMQDRTANPMWAMPRRPMPDRSVAPPPDRPGRSDMSVLPMPDRPGRSSRPVPPISTPPRPVLSRPTQPVRPDWSWNWDTILPGIVLPLSPARVRFYSAAVRGPIQIHVNNRLMAPNLNFLNYSRIYNVIPGRYHITVYRGNDMRSSLVDTWTNFQQNQDYTVALVDSGSNFQLQTFSL